MGKKPMHSWLIEKNIINYCTQTPIRGIIIGDEFKTIEIAKKLFSKGFGVTAAMYPTVARNESILRITIGADHKEKDIIDMCKQVKKLLAL